MQPGDTISPAECALVYKAPTPSPLILGKDPLLATQWHLYNDGSLPGTKAGEDLHLNGIWRWGRGEGVRVAVVDDGLDVIHGPGGKRGTGRQPQLWPIQPRQ